MTASRKSLSLLVTCVAAAIATAALATDLRIVNEGDVAVDWQPAGGKPLATASYPAGFADRSRDICINIGYQIDKKGVTSQFSILRAWSSENPDSDASGEALRPFVQSAAAAVSLWKFEPTAGASVNREMYSSVSIPFVGSRGGDADSIRARCRISDLKDYIAKEKIAAYRRGSLAKDKLDRYRRDNNQQQ